jgi:acyl carrier protein
MHTPTRELTDDTWLTLINAIIPFAANGKARHIRLTLLDAPLAESGLDSLDSAVLGAYLCEIFDVPLPLHRDFHPRTAREAIEFLRSNAQRAIHTPEEIVGMLETAAP